MQGPSRRARSDRLFIIDAALLYGADRGAWNDVARRIDQVCREWGFFYIAGHPLPATRFGTLLAAARESLALPVEEKSKIDIARSRNRYGYGAIATGQLDSTLSNDSKETFDMVPYPPTEHPDVRVGKLFCGLNRHSGLPGWEALLEGYCADMLALVRTTLRALVTVSGTEGDLFDRRFGRPVSIFRLIHYPPAAARRSTDQPGTSAYTDYDCVTPFYQDATGGLQVQNRQGEWIDASPIGDTSVVNTGDMTVRRNNNRHRSTPHQAVGLHGVHHYFTPFSAEPHMDTEIRYLPDCFDADNPPEYPSATCGEWLTSRSMQIYTYRCGKTA